MRINEFFGHLGEAFACLFAPGDGKSGGKNEFLSKLRKSLRDLSKSEIDEHIAFYSEMIDDRMEEGLSEEEAVAAIGTVDEIARLILADRPGHKKKTSRRTGTTLLLIIGSPLWGSLLIAFLAVVFAVWVSIWAVVISLWAAFVALAVCLPAAVAMVLIVPGVGGAAGLATVGTGFVCAGFAIFLFFGCRALTKGCALFTKRLPKALFGRRDRSK